jgi:hypothetical protein
MIIRIRRNLNTFTLFILLSFFLTACNSSTLFIDFEQYEGRPLNIGVIGEFPEVREENINFIPINFSELEDQKIDSYDAIFIMKEHLSQASHSKYAKIYKNAKIPFFFIQTEKSYLPFVDESITYEGAIKPSTTSYATGYLNTGDEIKYWEYGLYNDIENEKTIKEVFSRIFMTIEEEKIKRASL